jgi:hypothetical protein
MTTPHDRDDDKVGAVRVTDGRRRGIGRLWPLLAGLLLLVLALLALTQCGADDDAATGQRGAAADAAGGTLTAGGTDLLALSAAAGSGGGLSRYSGQQAEGRGVTVESVPADEGFWVGTGAQERVWVQLTGAAGESPFEVEAGDRVSFAGSVTAHPEGFAEEIGVTVEEGADLLQAQGQHIEVPRAELQLDG